MSIIPYERSFASHEKSKYWSNKNGSKIHIKFCRLQRPILPARGRNTSHNVCI